MALFYLSLIAERDLLNIAAYTLRTWGEEQTVRYLDGLEELCEQLTENPEMGRTCEHIRPALRRMEHGKHVLFYRKAAQGITVSRILHQGMMPSRQVFDDDNQ